LDEILKNALLKKAKIIVNWDLASYEDEYGPARGVIGGFEQVSLLESSIGMWNVPGFMWEMVDLLESIASVGIP
jgi:hypothetical protein